VNYALPEPRVSEPEKPGVIPANAKCLVFYGTLVMRGNLTCIVHATGDNTLLGKIAKSINRPRPRSSLEIAMEQFVHFVAYLSIAVGLFTALAEYNMGKTPVKVDSRGN